jgi:hypothetical protein
MTSNQASRSTSLKFIVAIALSLLLGCASTVAMAQSSKLDKKAPITKHEGCEFC